MLRAVIWDVDGTIAETERDGHRVAFNAAFEAHGLSWRWDVATYGDLLRVAGGFERLMHDMEERRDAPAGATRAVLGRSLHRFKNEAYARIVAEGRIGLRPGVLRLMDECRADGVAQAIATTTSRANVDALFHGAFGAGWSRRFGAIVCAEDAPAKKPDPLAYVVALDRLGLAAVDVVAIEDSPNGLAAARAAGIATVVTRSDYFRDAVFAEASAVCDGLDSPIAWHGGAAPRVDLAVLRSVLQSRTARLGQTTSNGASP